MLKTLRDEMQVQPNAKCFLQRGEKHWKSCDIVLDRKIVYYRRKKDE